MRVPFVSSRKRGRQRLKPIDTGPGPQVDRIPRDVLKNLKKVNWTRVWRIKKVSREERMTEALHQLVSEFEEKMSVIFQQLVKESEDLKNDVRELHRTCEMLRAEKTTLKAENLKLKNGILHSIETMRDSLAAIVGEADESAVGLMEAGQEAGGAVM
jgi:hypothetical protein